MTTLKMIKTLEGHERIAGDVAWFAEQSSRQPTAARTAGGAL
jgi:hypothetical protein